MRIGVNYVPRRDWFYQWAHLDRLAIRDDLQAIAGIGADHVRIFPLWPLLQPNRTFISPAALDDLETMVDEASHAGLKVDIDLLQGHLSSYDFLPSWVLSWHRRNLFTDPEVIAAQTQLLRAVAKRFKDHSVVRGISLGNEIIQFAAQRHPETQPVSEAAVHSWVSQLLQAAQQSWPQGIHTLSYDDDLLFDPAHPFTPATGLTLGDEITVHSWIFGRLGPTLGPDHPRLALFARYLLELVQAWARALGNNAPLWLQEVGAPLNYLSPQHAPNFLQQTLDQAATVANLAAITWWCSHDVTRELADFPAVEYDLGLFDQDGKLKPTGEAFAQWISQYRAGKRLLPPHKTSAPTSSSPRSQPQSGVLWIPGPQHPQAREIMRADGKLFARWAEGVECSDPLVLIVEEA